MWLSPAGHRSSTCQMLPPAASSETTQSAEELPDGSGKASTKRSTLLCTSSLHGGGARVGR